MTTARVRAIVAVHLLLVRDGQLLLLRRFATGYEDGNYSVPAGHLDGGEPVTSAAIREAWEEVGVAIARQDLRVALVMHRRAEEERIDVFLEAERLHGEPHNREPHKCDELRWCPIDALPENVVPYVGHAIACVRQGTTFDEYGWP